MLNGAKHKRIFLTGAAGYIGLHIVRELLATGHELTAFVRSPGRLGPFARASGLRILEGDLEHASHVVEALKGHDVCVHAAFLWGEVPGTEFELRDTAVAAKLFDAAGSVGVSRCVYLSSVAVHRPFTSEMREGDCLCTTDTYGATKAAGELFLRAACAQHQMTGIVIRPGPVVGPPAFEGGALRTDRRVADMVAAARAGRPIEVSEQEGRQLSDVASVAETTRLVICAESPHRIYNCVDRDILTWERIARTVVECLNSSSAVHVLPPKAQEPIPYFRTERIEALLGGPRYAGQALMAHIRYLARASEGKAL